MYALLHTARGGAAQPAVGPFLAEHQHGGGGQNGTAQENWHPSSRMVPRKHLCSFAGVGGSV